MSKFPIDAPVHRSGFGTISYMQPSFASQNMASHSGEQKITCPELRALRRPRVYASAVTRALYDNIIIAYYIILHVNAGTRRCSTNIGNLESEDGSMMYNIYIY